MGDRFILAGINQPVYIKILTIIRAPLKKEEC